MISLFWCAVPVGVIKSLVFLQMELLAVALWEAVNIASHSTSVKWQNWKNVPATSIISSQKTLFSGIPLIEIYPLKFTQQSHNSLFLWQVVDTGYNNSTDDSFFKENLPPSSTKQSMSMSIYCQVMLTKLTHNFD